MSYDTATLMGVYKKLIPHDTFLLNLLFLQTVLFTTKKISFDGLSDEHKLAPFVSPSVAGKPNTSAGSTLKEFAPAYVKPLDVVDPERVLKRIPGEGMGGVLSAEERANAIRVDILDSQRARILKRMEWMAAQLCRTGTIVVSGEDYPTQVVDFGRNPNNTVTLVGDARWGEASAAPNENIENWMALMTAPCTHIIFGANAWTKYIADESTEKLINTLRGSDTKLAMEPAQMFAAFRGTLGAGGPELWTYKGFYHDDNGDKQTFLHPDDVLLCSTAGGGVRAYGAIMDGAANYIATEIFPKIFTPDNPGVEQVMSQSAPLPVMPEIDSTVCATVL